MKELITTIASLLLLLTFLVQFTGAQIMQDRLFQADRAVASFRDAVKAEGGISGENRTRLTNELVSACGCDPVEIVIEVDRMAGEAERGEILSYTVRFPLRPVIAMGSFFGIGAEENQAWSQDRGWVVSQYPGLPSPEPEGGDGSGGGDGDGGEGGDGGDEGEGETEGGDEGEGEAAGGVGSGGEASGERIGGAGGSEDNSAETVEGGEKVGSRTAGDIRRAGVTQNGTSGASNESDSKIRGFRGGGAGGEEDGA